MSPTFGYFVSWLVNILFIFVGIDLILCHLTDMKASKAVDSVIEGIPAELRERRLPFKALCHLME